ncbi:uncharacterized protein LOC128299279 [Anopheles moucheti]|uniref:uncharacterized protein LOC128299279 n=1 Tax=Anopheles moucheti TaxID=186751 RepID=UPI0022F0B2F2|nr:uncharacterized protein LOC128299279 [Anopheles moucheti]
MRICRKLTGVFNGSITMALSRFLVVCSVLGIAILLQPYGGGQIWAQELFAFPADVVVNPYLENARNRTPVYVPGKCSKNEILYPGDHDNDWVCDCRPGYVYAPLQDSCFQLYQQGYCQPGEYVDLERPSMIVKCTRNICPGKNEVPYMKKCVQLHQNNRLCKIEKRISWVIAVNTTTLELGCVQGTTDMLEVGVNNRNTEDNDETLPMQMKREPVVYFEGATLCHIGTKAKHNGQCH